jgi:hypothetical protein
MFNIARFLIISFRQQQDTSKNLRSQWDFWSKLTIVASEQRCII